MSNKTITDYTLASGIDPINDYFLIESLNVYYKINRNTILGLTGTPADISSTQTLSNKSLNNTNSIMVKDSSFTLENSSDTTKRVNFSLANITTATTRTITLPNSSSTLATLTGTENLTNKTITGAAISGGTIDNATVTVDSISGHTSSTIVNVANLQISNGVLNSANAVTATSIAAGAVQPQALVSGTGSGWTWQTWSPTYANINTTGGTVDAKYIQIGKTVIGRWFFVLGAGSSVGTAPCITYPVVPLSTYYTPTATVVGTARLIANGVGYQGAVWAFNSTQLQPIAFLASGTYVQEQGITSSIPNTWGSGNSIEFTFCYEVA